MKKEVREALKGLEADLMYGDGLEVTVSRNDLRQLVEWAARKRDTPPTSELEVGDRVKLKIDWLAKTYCRKGNKGTVLRIGALDGEYPYAIIMDKAGADSTPVHFKRDEIKRLTK